MHSPITIQISADPTSEEAAAAVAAIVSLLAAQPAPDAADAAPKTSRWRDAARLAAQGMAPARTLARPGWGSIERIRRVSKGDSGITGM